MIFKSLNLEQMERHHEWRIHDKRSQETGDRESSKLRRKATEKTAELITNHIQ